MLLEEPNGCSLCGHHVRGFVGGVPVYFCPNCYTQYRDAIFSRTAWLVYLSNAEKQRRKRRNRMLKGPGLPQMTNTYQGVLL